MTLMQMAMKTMTFKLREAKFSKKYYTLSRSENITKLRQIQHTRRSDTVVTVQAKRQDQASTSHFRQ